MTKLVNRAKMTTATTGTGTITLGSAVDGYQTFAAAGVADADVVRYVIEDGDAWEIGLGTYTASGTTLTRGSIESSNSDLAINLSGNALVFLTVAGGDLQHAADMDQGVATTDDPTFTGVDLAAIAASKAVTAVDVFVYDTSKDSDGGAWRKRCQHTSWYNEPLNTATRGSRREFPAVAVIVAESNKVTIYDGDDPAMPMWMVFTLGAGNMVWRNASDTITSVSAIEGQVAVGKNTSSGISIVKFASDSGLLYYNNGYYSVGNVLQRNSAFGITLISSAVQIVNNSVNDVAMTVLPDAPIDPATGLPVPTIAVATNGNGTYSTSVITDDGTVYDIASDSTGTAVSVAFDGVSLSAVRSDGTVYVWDNVGSITADGASPDATYSTSSTPALRGPVSEVAA